MMPSIYVRARTRRKVVADPMTKHPQGQPRGLAEGGRQPVEGGSIAGSGAGSLSGSIKVTLGWGSAPRTVQVPASARVVWPPRSPPPITWAAAVARALASPVGSAPLAERAAAARRIVVLVPDDTRKDIARQLLPLVLPHLGGAQIEVGIATGKHPPFAPPPGIDWVHDARSPALVRVGHTAHGTEVRYSRAVLDADLRVLLGELRPHYFAGWAGGAKMLFPGVAGEAGIWHNHRLKAAPGARLGVVDGNPCRADMEAAAALAGPSFSLNVVRGEHGEPVDAVAGDPVASHRLGVARAQAVFEVEVEAPADVVLISDADPVAMNLYQACKLLPPAGAVLRDGGTVVLAVECGAGIGPVEVINDAIYHLGSRHSLPPNHRVILVSRHGPDAVAPTFAEWAPDIETALVMASDQQAPDLIVMPRGGDLVPRLRNALPAHDV
jgi:hypothetical protein